MWVTESPHHLPDQKTRAYYNRKGQEEAIYTPTTYKYSEPKQQRNPKGPAKMIIPIRHQKGGVVTTLVTPPFYHTDQLV